MRRRREQATLVLIKPDAITRGLSGEILSRLDSLRLDVIGAKAVRPNRQMAYEHYKPLRNQPFFGQLIDYLTGKLHKTSHVLVFVLWGPDAVARVRQVTGATHPERADPRSIRGALGRITSDGLMENLLHASADLREAEREIKLWFTPQELLRNPFSTRRLPASAAARRTGGRVGAR